MAIEGTLKDMSLTTIIQLNCREQRRARVTVHRGHESGTLYFADGQVVHATQGELRGENAVYALLEWQAGHFTIENNVSSPRRSIQMPWNALLLRGMKRVDEASVERDQSGKEDHRSQTIQQHVQELADRIEGLVGAHVVDSDGTVICDVLVRQAFDRDAIVPLEQAVKRLKRTLDTLDAGGFKETITLTSRYRFIVRSIGRGEYYIRVMVLADSNIGAVRMYLEDTEHRLRRLVSATAQQETPS